MGSPYLFDSRSAMSSLACRFYSFMLTKTRVVLK
jgi:hypothetical protein